MKPSFEVDCCDTTVNQDAFVSGVPLIANGKFCLNSTRIAVAEQCCQNVLMLFSTRGDPSLRRRFYESYLKRFKIKNVLRLSSKM